MSTHVSIERIHEALDGLLTAEESRRVETHLDSCAACRNEYARTSETVSAIRSLPSVATPPDGVWRAVAARIADRPPEKVAREADVLSLPTAGAGRRRLTFSVPQLAAAAIAVSLLSAGTVWLALGDVTSVAAPAPGTFADAPGGAAARAVSTESGRYEDVVDRLEQILEQGRAVLAPSTLLTIEQSLRTVDAAIADVEAALEEDPNSGLLRRLLTAHQRTKLGVLQRAASAVQAQA